MTSRERVLTAMRHGEPDKVPKGELGIGPVLTRRLLGETTAASLSPVEREREVRRRLAFDLINLCEFPVEEVGRDERGYLLLRSILGDEYAAAEGGSSQLVRPALTDIAEAPSFRVPHRFEGTTAMLDWFAVNSDLFLLAQICGPVSLLDRMFGTRDYLMYCMTHPREMLLLTEEVMRYELARGRRCLDHGADAILIGDDIAYNRGLFLPPEVMDELVWPFYRRAISSLKKHRDVPVLMHTDGDVRAVLDRIVDCGFDGLQSLQPSAGMDIEAVKRDHGDRLCLMGNLDLDYLMPFGKPEDVERQVRRLCETVGPGGGFILSTCNILTDAVPPENALAMTAAAERYGRYPLPSPPVSGGEVFRPSA